MATVQSTPKMANPHGPVGAAPIPQAAKPAGAAVAAGKEPRDYQRWLFGGVGALVLLLIGLGIWMLMTRQTGPLPVNADTDKLVKFVCGKQYLALPWKEQEIYMKVLDKRGDEMLKAYREQKINSTEYRTAMGEAWLGKHLIRVEKYNSAIGFKEKTAVLEKIYDDKHEPGGEKAPKGKGTITTITGQPLDPVERDTRAEKLRISTFPADIQEQSKKFDKEYKKYKKEREAEEDAAAVAAARAKAAAATRPATVPVGKPN